MKKAFKGILGVAIGLVGLAWFVWPVSTWHGFLFFVILTVVVVLLALLRSYLDDDNVRPEGLESHKLD